MRRLRNTGGVTLVEVMVALVILLLVFMGLMQSALLSIDHNLRNNLRDEAVAIADQRMNGRLNDDSNTRFDGLRTVPFDTLAATATWPAWTPTIKVTRDLKNVGKPFNVSSRIRNYDANTIRIDVAVGWNHRNENALQAPTNTEYVHRITTLRRR